MINAIESNLAKRSDELLSVLRIVSSFMFIQHGTQKMFGFPIEMRSAYDIMTLSPGLAGLIEVVGGLLLLIGLFTRKVAFVCSGMMAFAFWMVHAGPNFFLWTVGNGGDAPVLYCFVFLYIAAVGGGKWSVDGMRAS